MSPNMGKIPVENALAIIEQAALALKAASEKSIVHRDIKPSNLMVTRDGRVKGRRHGPGKNPHRRLGIDDEQR